MTLSNNLSNAFEQLAKLPQQKITQVIILVLLSYIAFLFAQITWLGLAKSDHNANLTLNDLSSVSVAPKEQVQVKAIQVLNLFGVFSQQNVNRVEEVVEDAPETRLQLILTGVVASTNKATAAAVIESGGKQETYSIGENIKGTRAVLEDVFHDRVLLKVSGGLETLMFEGLIFDKNINIIKPRYNQQSVTQPTENTSQKSSPDDFSPTNIVDQRDNKALAQVTKSLRTELASDPGNITDYLKISPKRENGKITGYQLMPAKDPTFFQSAGLKSGDVAVQMNGFDLTAPQEAAQALQSLKEQREVSLLLDRNGDITEILFSIDN
ncbi:type II secretion system protein GspC [Colwellia sp. MB02u-18]|uniref:type II secretion system protein GspC n=1 Tax=unclassified Colwellia TaxID=196834 RepID=UPI0015F60E57|nr:MULTISPECIES: type II secretion system protein GspC [unclassified Colwellia]MBA6223451.1 type II secretion system protein GspC [Colwellia sp. MB3u-45]MBA6267976.1 type II secretion system protein GspC [Colwellia sp. MB3u-43]MBA6321635.1 type II secretion system protein GspC [Colwellia sp. MB02u-19]MBA6325366.1 type II secretion system protein GspC [Colwellia sp. MB02u-18]MBA6330033.1 type II secretion system protein GspC [Colwellia sp. MB02u-12]